MVTVLALICDAIVVGLNAKAAFPAVSAVQPAIRGEILNIEALLSLNSCHPGGACRPGLAKVMRPSNQDARRRRAIPSSPMRPLPNSHRPAGIGTAELAAANTSVSPVPEAVRFSVAVPSLNRSATPAPAPPLFTARYRFAADVFGVVPPEPVVVLSGLIPESLYQSIAPASPL